MITIENLTKVFVTDEVETTALDRGSFFAATGGLWVFVVDPASQVASKRPVRLGRQNPSVYEVLEGLAEGEEVITSDYENFAHRDKVVLRAGGK